jgi:hypothetical protein
LKAQGESPSVERGTRQRQTRKAAVRGGAEKGKAEGKNDLLELGTELVFGTTITYEGGDKGSETEEELLESALEKDKR